MQENKPNIQHYNKLVSSISKILSEAKSNIATTVNTTMVVTNWHIGQYIVEYEQGGKERAEYGTQLLKRLSEDLTKEFGRGFSWRNLYNMKEFYMQFPILQTSSAKLETVYKILSYYTDFSTKTPRPNSFVKSSDKRFSNCVPYSARSFPPCSYSTIYCPICQLVSTIVVFTVLAILLLASDNILPILETNLS